MNNIISTNLGNLQYYPNFNTDTNNYVYVIYTSNDSLANSIAVDISGIINIINSITTRINNIETNISTITQDISTIRQDIINLSG